MTGRQIIEIVLILVIFLSGFIPILMGIVHYAREIKRIDREKEEKRAKAASHHSM